MRRVGTVNALTREIQPPTLNDLRQTEDEVKVTTWPD